ncbi:protein LYK5 [Cornus florida]|uniref:protein LYK5 n=1 Tax=Cornus florida TaxID=4283 RepID=UPI00289FF47D|nr:protein LYK5 [Cornus florida]
MAMKMKVPIFLYSFVPFLVLLSHLGLSQGQQSYVNNKQLDCERNYTVTEGYVCNGPLPSCNSYLTFRSNPTYSSPATIGYLLSAQPAEIARINNVSDVHTFPTDTIVVVPVNCSCTGGEYYQHNATYVLKTTGETYFSVVNNTYQGLSTCQALIAQNPYNFRDLQVDMRLNIPLRCACPSSNQTSNGVKYLLTYLVTRGDDLPSIGDIFGVDNLSISDANQLSGLIFPFTPLLVPLKTEPIRINTTAVSLTPPPPPSLPTVPVDDSNSSSSHKWVYVGVGAGSSLIVIIILCVFLVWVFRRRRSQQSKPIPVPIRPGGGRKLDESADCTALPDTKSWSVSSEGIRSAVESLTVYKFEDLQKATGFFNEENRIKGSVYQGSFKGDDAAVKIIKGDVFREINILKQINHFNIIRLSGFCVREGNTYLVYEYAEKGSLSDWLHFKGYQTSTTSLSWKERVQIAYDVADALNYLHNYTNPPYVHKNLKTSNILLDGNLRAKVANFGLARTLENEDQGGLQLTRHVVGTYGYMAPEYIENGLVTPKLDVFAFGVVVLELLSGKEANGGGGGGGGGDKNEEELLSVTINQVLGEPNVTDKLRGFIDPCLKREYPLDLAYSIAELAKNCVAHDLNSRPTIADVFMTLSKIQSSSLDWDPSDELDHSRSLGRGR